MVSCCEHPYEYCYIMINKSRPPGHKESVKALVRNHAKPTLPGIEATYNISAAIDLVRGKGKGLIILLHGEPGMVLL